MALKVKFTRRADRPRRNPELSSRAQPAWRSSRGAARVAQPAWRSPRGAERVGAQIFAMTDRLADLPRLGHVVEGSDVRVVQLSRYPYRIYYIVQADTLAILHIRHTARRSIDPAKVLAEDA